MNVKLIEGTDNPEELVCTAARNDYRDSGVIGFDYDEVMEPVDGDTVAEKQETLIGHLMDSGHWGVFEHPQATVAIEGVTRVLMAQITRHRHFTFDVMSLRYVGLDDEDLDIEERFQFPEFRGEDFDVDREGVHEIENPDIVEGMYRDGYEHAIHIYRELLDQGVPQEQARKVLPMGTKVNIVMSGTARSWMHILGVRTKADVQGETRRCAEAIFEELKEWMPYSFSKYDSDVLPLRLNP